MHALALLSGYLPPAGISLYIKIIYPYTHTGRVCRDIVYGLCPCTCIFGHARRREKGKRSVKNS